MHKGRTLRRSVLLALSLLSACAAAGVSGAATEAKSRANGHPDDSGAAAAYLVGRFAAAEGDLKESTDQLLQALVLDPANPDIRQQAFVVALLAGRPEAAKLAQEQGSDPAALLVLADQDAKAGNWDSAEKRFAALPRQGVTQVLQPLLQAWAQVGAGHPDTALATLKPFVEAQRFRAVYAFHSAMIADLASRPGDAAKFYKIAETEFGAMNMDLARAMASWQFRQGHEADGRATLAAMAAGAPDFAIALPRLQADIATRQTRRATDGIAESYLALAVALRQQEGSEFASILLRLALDLRTDLTLARMLAADLSEQAKRPDAALAVLSGVAASDPLAPVVDMRRAGLQDRMGNADEALRIAAAVSAAYPDRPEPWALQGALLRSKHDYREAVAAYDKAVALTKPPLTRVNWPLFYERAIALERSHDWPRAEADFQHALQLSPDEPFVLNYLAYSWTEMRHELPKARQMIQRAAEQRPNDGAILDSLGWVMLQQGDTPAGVKWLEKASELEPQDATINGHLGDAYWAAGRKLEAQYQWRRALNLNPEPDDLPKLKAKLHEAEQAVGIVAPPTPGKAVQ